MYIQKENFSEIMCVVNNRSVASVARTGLGTELVVELLACYATTIVSFSRLKLMACVCVVPQKAI